MKTGPRSSWENIFSAMRRRLGRDALPSVSQIAKEGRDPFRILISTMISLRTKDEVTAEASRRLFKEADTPETTARLPEKKIARLIFPAGFYRRKAENIRKTALQITERFDSAVPADLDALISLPGVGRKTANLVLNLGFGIEAICVDTHVHRISNRLGWVKTKNPEASEYALMEVLPRKFWIEINELFVSYGKKVCTPVSPRCSTCPVEKDCPKQGVDRSR
jgi:endonuclease-3